MKREQGPISGFRDFLPEQMIPREMMIEKIKRVFEGMDFPHLKPQQ